VVKRKNWIKPAEPAREQTAVCKVCKRKFYPKEKSDTCINCQKVFTTAAKKLAAEKLRQSQHPVKRLFESCGPEPKAQADKERMIPCNLCGVNFLSTGFENCTCDKCRKNNANISNLGIPSSQGHHSRTD
jgi:hypothetical protein